MDLCENNTFCMEYDITSSKLFEDEHELSPLPIVKKGLVLELFLIQKRAKLPWATCAKWVYSLCGQEAPHPASALRRSLSSLHSKKTSLQKRSSRAVDLKCFLDEPFALPSHTVATRNPSERIKRSTGTTQSKIESEAIKAVNTALAKEVANLQSVCSVQQDQLDKKDDKIKRLEQYKPHNVRRRIQRREAVIVKQKEQIKQQSLELKGTHQEVTKKLRDQLRYYKQKSMKVEDQDEADDECEFCSTSANKVEELQMLYSDLLEENACLKEEITQHKTRTITTMVNGRYTEEVRLCVMDLLSHNVGIKKVEPVIRAVLQLANVTCHHLPQPTAISDMLLEGRVLSQIQLVETLTARENLTLHSDGTTKFGHKYSSYQVSTDDKSMTLGVQVCMRL